jgi:CRP-like cAMP-binding protein
MAHTGVHTLDLVPTFDPAHFLACAGAGRRIVHFDPKGALFSQGDSADSDFYLQNGRLKVTVVSANGKEATITLLSAGDFIGEDSLAGTDEHRTVTVTAITSSDAMKITRSEMIRVMHDEHAFSDLFLSHLLARSMRIQADLVDQLFNSSEKRLARLLLLMADYGEPGEPTTFIPPISQETLAEMIGTTRSRVSFFMNRFRKLGLIDYNGRIQVHKSLLKAVLLDHLPEHGSQAPRLAPKSADSLDRFMPRLCARERLMTPTCVPRPLQQKLAHIKGPMGPRWSLRHFRNEFQSPHE